MKLWARLASIGFLFLATTGVVGAAAAPPSKSQCFFVHQFRTWKALDDKTIVIRVDPQRFYRLDLAVSCAGIRSPGIFLVTMFRGPSLVCDALDWDITIKDSLRGPTQSCIVKNMTLLFPDEVAAIPRKLKP
jgi:hypothetical protein